MEKIKMVPVSSGMVDKGSDFGSSNIRKMKPAKVAMLTGDGVSAYADGEIWSFFDQEINYRLSLINAGDFGRINWPDIDVLILPDGKYDFLENKEQANQFLDWIRKGGRVIALEKAAEQLSNQKWSVVHVKEDTSGKSVASKVDIYHDIKVYRTENGR